MSSVQLTRRLVGNYLRPYRGRLLLAVLFMAIYAAANSFMVWLLKPIMNGVFFEKDPSLLVIAPLALIATVIIKGIADYGQSVLTSNIGLRVIDDFQNEMFAHLMRADLAFFHNNSTGNLISKFTNDVNLLRAAVSNVLISVGRELLTLIGLMGVMISTDWRLSLAVFFIFPIAVLPIVRIGRKIRRVSANTQAEIGNLATLLSETFQGARHVKAYGMEQYEQARASKIIGAVFRQNFKAARVRAVGRPLMESLGVIGAAGIIYYGGRQVVSGHTTTGAFIAFLGAFIAAYQPMKALGSLNTFLQEGLGAAERVFAMLDIEPEITDREHARALVVKKGQIDFDRVSFSYGPDGHALHEVSLRVPAGKTVALVGPSGAGKSTILNLIPRFYDVKDGRILVDGMDVRDATLASLRANIALVSQEISLFDDTVRANIAYGRWGCSEDDIVEAAKRAAAHDFIVNLPEGYDTPVGEHGVKLSGGQRQRIAIARAMVKNAPILLLDEATSSLDTESERQVQAALAELTKGRTTLVIAHRLSTITAADLIYVIEEGRATERGTNAELLARRGTYARLYALQFAEETREAGTSRVQIVSS
ncbi:MAG: lipid A export permease/ATP-binding protein MsbA [Alphaproteobacteria bacterium]